MLSQAFLGILIFLLPFSPKIPLDLFSYRLEIRLDDITLPLLLFLWLIELLRKQRRLIFSHLYWPIALYFLVGLTATLRGYSITGTITNPFVALLTLLRSAEYYILFFLTVNILKTTKQMLGYFYLWLGAALLIVFYGLWDGFFHISGPTGLYDQGWFWRQSNHMGGYLMVSLLVALSLLNKEKKKGLKVCLVVAVGLIAGAILLNLSRTTYISSLVACSIFFACTKKRLTAIPIACAVIIFLVIPVFFSGTMVGKRIGNMVHDIFSLSTTPVDRFDSMAVHRIKFYAEFREFPQRLFLGSGLGAEPLSSYDSQIVFVPLSTGITGSALFIWLLFSIFQTALKLYSNTADSEIKYWLRVFFAIFAGVLVHSIVSVGFMIALIAYPFWFMTAVMVVLPLLSPPQKI